MDRAIKEQIMSIIDDVDDMTIATRRDDGYPQATTVSYVNDGLAIYFGTSATSQKAGNIARCDKVSLTINRPYETWNDIESLSIGGRAMQVTDPEEQAKVGQLMFKKFPLIMNYVSVDKSMAELALFRIDPELISLLDYAKGFGHTEQFDVREDRS
jgi:nitroimidazol reductase NimA-like FMN-containing flavoprotein (pyridoxamine 5'-phosphate oxidase superfamily)